MERNIMEGDTPRKIMETYDKDKIVPVSYENYLKIMNCLDPEKNYLIVPEGLVGSDVFRSTDWSNFGKYVKDQRKGIEFLENRNLWKRANFFNFDIGQISGAMIGSLYDCKIGKLEGDSVINLVLGNTQIDYMCNTSIIERLIDESRVHCMGGKSRVRCMGGKSRVHHMDGESIIEEMRWRSKVFLMRNESSVLKMFGLSNVVCMEGESRVLCRYGRSSIGSWWGKEIYRFFSLAV